ncbi:hypothetical protein Ddye_006034 [Dipteronia dyeriana]|uniref:Uncharacterized protein n=1 Tax=Dipteronia dyeriana TaxID=168575 RepID=A0AAE0CQC9_9ROSI|nr:hypothetical protein Ddye_006034 [Dipteronia dyeriana]
MMNNNGYGGDESNAYCYFHPKEYVVGVCPLCLNERLLVLASKQSSHHHQHNNNNSKKPPKIFALGSLFNRFEFRHWKSDAGQNYACSSSQEESFISIKFEEDGAASWEKGTVSKVVSMEEHCSNMSSSWSESKDHHQYPNRHNNNNTNNTNKNNKNKTNQSQSVVEHGKPRAPLRWRKRIGHLMQLLRWKRSSKVAVESGGGVKVMRKGWIRTLTKRGPSRNKPPAGIV